jgi:hypothetical protein
MNKKNIIAALIIYLVSSAASFSVFSYFDGGKDTVVQDQQQMAEDGTLLGSLLDISPDDPKNQSCPLNGGMFTKKEKDAWEARRPLYVMIENHPEARPQSGLAAADIVFEAVAEGGVTRFGAMYYCDAQSHDTTLAPIRSARTYYLDWASGFNFPMYVHVGGANVPGPTNALGQINDYGWALENDINQFSVGYPTFIRDYNRVEGKDIATEHTMVTTTEKLWEVSLDREWTNMSPDRKIGRKTIKGTNWLDGYEGWSYEDSAEIGTDALEISYDFWSGYGDYSVEWSLDPETGKYLRTMGGDKHMDMNDDAQIAAANVVVLLTTEKGPINEKKHMIYGTVGTGDALIFKHGVAIDAKWSKKSRTAELKFVDAKGKDVEMARGLTWISVLAKGSEVDY